MSNSEVYLTRDEIEHPYANLAVMLEDKRRKAEQISRTVFAHITQSPEVLAPYCITTKPSVDGNTLYYYSTVTSHIYLTESQALSATVEKLKEVDSSKENIDKEFKALKKQEVSMSEEERDQMLSEN